MAKSRHLNLGKTLGVLAVISGLSLVGYSQVRQSQIVEQVERVVERIEHETEVRVAENCVNAHERIEAIRDGDEVAYRRNAETLIEISDADPDVIARYRRLVDRDVVEIRAVNPDPDCDVDEAQAFLRTTEPS